MLSLLVWHKVITLSGFYCISVDTFASPFCWPFLSTIFFVKHFYRPFLRTIYVDHFGRIPSRFLKVPPVPGLVLFCRLLKKRNEGKSFASIISSIFLREEVHLFNDFPLKKTKSKEKPVSYFFIYRDRPLMTSQ